MATGPSIEGEKWGEVGFNDEEAATLKRLTGGDRAKLLDHLEATGPAFAELARRLELPRPGCRAGIDEFARSEHRPTPSRRGWSRAPGASMWWTACAPLRAMLHAGIVLVRDGEPAFRAVPDPFGSGPFQHRTSGERLPDPLGVERRREAGSES